MCQTQSRFTPNINAGKSFNECLGEAGRRHVCHVPACETPCAPRLLMCAPHWRRVPPALKSEVERHYTPGQERWKPMPKREWIDAAKKAIAAVTDTARERPCTD